MLTELADGLRLEGVFLKRVFKIRPKNWFLRFELKHPKKGLRFKLSDPQIDFPKVLTKAPTTKNQVLWFDLAVG